MSLKLIVGIVLPLAVIIALVGLTTSSSGIVISSEAVPSVLFDEVLTNETVWQRHVQVMTLHLENSFFMAKKAQLPPLMICANDREDKLDRHNIPIQYSEGIYNSRSYDPIFGDPMYYSYDRAPYVEVPAKGKKEVRIYANAVQFYRGKDFQEYDELLIIESQKKNKQGNYNRLTYFREPCFELTDEDLAEAIVIPLVRE